jgi:hypothetical protein
MADDRSDFATDRVDAGGRPLADQALRDQPPRAPDVDQPDADVEQSIEDTSTDDLFVQGGA